MPSSSKRTVTGLILFGIAFGYVEAAVVVYLRTIYDPVRLQIRPGVPAGDLFPLITRAQLRAAAPERMPLVRTEVVREAGTLIMLAAAALMASAHQPGRWLPAFAIAFGVWDFFFYVFLKVLIGWPASLFTWDILFLIPAPWAAPVLAPMLVSLSIFTAGMVALWRNIRPGAIHWIGIVLANILILASFLWDSPNLIAGGLPHPFLWWLFGAGELLGLGAFFLAVRQASLSS